MTICPRQGNGSGYIWFTEDLSHSAARAIEREASGGRSKSTVTSNPAVQPGFCHGPRFGEHFTQARRSCDSCGVAVTQTPHSFASSSQSLLSVISFSDQLADVDGAKATGTRHFFGAPHVQDTHELEKIICGSSKLTEHKELHEVKHGDLSGMLKGRSFQQQMFEGHAGLSLQADDGGVGAIRRNSAASPEKPKMGTAWNSLEQLGADLGGAPHVADSPDMFELVCGSPTLKEAHAKKANPALANMFGGCAGLYLQARCHGESRSSWVVDLLEAAGKSVRHNAGRNLEESWASSHSEYRGGFRQSRGRMLLERGARSTTPTLKEPSLQTTKD
eukprot:Skav213647  [mRNA]  locus=scaffold2012:243357:260908:+ [translate_table: standard]